MIGHTEGDNERCPAQIMAVCLLPKHTYGTNDPSCSRHDGSENEVQPRSSIAVPISSRPGGTAQPHRMSAVAGQKRRSPAPSAPPAAARGHKFTFGLAPCRAFPQPGILKSCLRAAEILRASARALITFVVLSCLPAFVIIRAKTGAGNDIPLERKSRVG